MRTYGGLPATKSKRPHHCRTASAASMSPQCKFQRTSDTPPCAAIADNRRAHLSSANESTSAPTMRDSNSRRNASPPLPLAAIIRSAATHKNAPSPQAGSIILPRSPSKPDSFSIKSTIQRGVYTTPCVFLAVILYLAQMRKLAGKVRKR